MELIWVLLAIPTILGLGFVAAAVDILTPPRRIALNAFAYYVALPALLFTSTADRPFAAIVTAEVLLGVPLVMGCTILLSIAVHHHTSGPGVRGVAIVQSYHSNFGYLGVPLVAIVFGEIATARAALILGIGAVIQVTATIVLLSTTTGRGSVYSDLRSVVVNPVMLALGAGLAAAALELEVPMEAMSLLDGVGHLALPLALICAGASLTFRSDAMNIRVTGNVVGIKILAMPALALFVFLAMGAEATTVQAAVLMFAMPTAVSTYVFASELGGNRELASMNVLVTTVISSVTLFVVVVLLQAIT